MYAFIGIIAISLATLAFSAIPPGSQPATGDTLQVMYLNQIARNELFQKSGMRFSTLNLMCRIGTNE